MMHGLALDVRCLPLDVHCGAHRNHSNKAIARTKQSLEQSNRPRKRRRANPGTAATAGMTTARQQLNFPAEYRCISSNSAHGPPPRTATSRTFTRRPRRTTSRRPPRGSRAAAARSVTAGLRASEWTAACQVRGSPEARLVLQINRTQSMRGRDARVSSVLALMPWTALRPCAPHQTPHTHIPLPRIPLIQCAPPRATTATAPRPTPAHARLAGRGRCAAHQVGRMLSLHPAGAQGWC